MLNLNQVAHQLFQQPYMVLTRNQKQSVSKTFNALKAGKEPTRCYFGCDQIGTFYCPGNNVDHWKCTLYQEDCKLWRETSIQLFGRTFNDLTSNQRYQLTCQIRYGATNAMHSKILREKHQQAVDKIDLKVKVEKQEQTCLVRYGVKNVMYSNEIRKHQELELIKATGYKYALQNPTIKAKQETTNEKRFGVRHAAQSEQIKQQVKKQWLYKYGGHPMKVEEIKQKHKSSCTYTRELHGEEIQIRTKATCLLRYGTTSWMKTLLAKNFYKSNAQLKWQRDSFLQTQEFQEKSKKTCLARYGVYPVTKSRILQICIKANCLTTYGFEHPMQNTIILKKAENTCIARYGTRWPIQTEELKRKSKATNLLRYGATHYVKSKAYRLKLSQIMLKSIATCRSHYGVDRPLQSAEIMNRTISNFFKRKTFTLPSGKVILLQGCEPKVLKTLLKCIPEKDIVCHPKFTIRYFCPYQKKIRFYHPDFYIPRLNWIVEAKSVWFLNHKGKDLDLMLVNLAKRQACLDLGYKFNFILR